MSSPQASLPKGGQFGDYRLVHEAHRSHYGVLHAAVSEATQQPAWVRVLPGPVLKNARVRQEVMAAANETLAPHPHLLRSLPPAVDGERIALVSDFAAGLPLATILRLWMSQDSKKVTGYALRLGLDLAKAVAHLHESPAYVAGALSPAAVLIGVDGVARIADAAALHAVFGVPALREHFDHLTYRAPEQLVAKPPAFRRCDVFTLGVMLFELLACKRLFSASGRAAIQKRIRTHVPDFTDRGVPLAVAGVLERALAKEQGERFADAGVMATALDAVEGASSREELRAFLEQLVGTHPSMTEIRKALENDSDATEGKSAVHPKVVPLAPQRPRQSSVLPLGIAKKARSRKPSVSEVKALTPTRLQGLPLTREEIEDPPTRVVGADAADEAPTQLREVEVDDAPTKLRTVGGDPPRLPPKKKPELSGAQARAEAPTRTSTYEALLEEVEASVPPPKESLDSLPPPADSKPPPPSRLDDVTGKRIGRCIVGPEIARGGMATVHLGRWHGAGGFAKTVAVKRLHPQYASDPAFVNMLLDEARVVSRVQHPNVTSTIDVLESNGELFIVMDYVHGVTLAHLLRQMRRAKEHVPVRIVTRIVNGMLHGLHAAHEATSETGDRLELIHRDVSPENVIVGVDGYSHLIDFGIARALGRFSHSSEGEVKGKLRYLSPEQVMGEPLHGQSDVFSASIVLWESLLRKRLYKGTNAGAIAYNIMNREPPPPSRVRADVSPAIDRVVLKGLEIERTERWKTAADMAEALEEIGGMASFREVGEWVQRIGAKQLERLESVRKEVESAPLELLDVDIEESLDVQSSLGLDFADLTEGTSGNGASADISLGDLPSHAEATESEKAKGRGWLVGVGVAAVAAAAIVVVASLGGDSETQPAPGPRRPATTTRAEVQPKPTPETTPPVVTEPVPEPSTGPSAEPAPEPSAEPSAEASASVPAPPPRTRFGKRAQPKPKPKPNPRLPDGI